VELNLDGKVVDAGEVALGVGQSQQERFALSGMNYGQYEMEVS